MEEFKLIPDETMLFDLTPEEVSLLFFLVGVALAQPLTIDEIDILANGLSEIAQVLAVIAAQRALINDALTAQQEKKDGAKAKAEEKSLEKMEAEIKKLQDHIEDLQKQIDGLKKQAEN